jgi:hypothetical protein
MFWSIMINRKATQGKMCLPPCKSGLPWDSETFMGKELHRVMAPGEHDKIPSGTRLKFSSRSHAACTFIGLQSHPCFRNGNNIPSTKNELPPWWRRCENLWNNSLMRVLSGDKLAPCMFFCTPLGCAAGKSCAAWHDMQWKADSDKWKSMSVQSRELS